METLNMSKLNLSSVRSHVGNDNGPKPEASEVKIETNSITDPDDEYHCEYREEIWKNLLEQDAEKPTIHLQSPQLEFRGALVQQLRDVTKKLGLSLATLHSAVAQLDLFMDAHRLRADRLTHVALACLSLAAKSEEKFSRAPTLKTLSKISGVQLCGKTFRQLEWMVGQHVRWRLLAPTPVTFAALLAQYVVTDSDLTTRHPKFVRRFKRDGAKLLEAYLDLTLSDVRLKVVGCVDVGCACVACARAELGLGAWPAWLAAAAGRAPADVAPIARLLQRMMQIMKSRDTTDSEVDQGYSSARTSPNLTPCTSPRYHISPASSTCSTSSNYFNVDTYRQRPIRSDYVLDLDDNVAPSISQDYYRLPTAVDMTCQRVDNPADYRFCRSNRLVEASLETVQPSTSMAVKRGLDTNIDIDRKRYRLATQMSQVVL
ncbi:G2/mitotic-specific cyclin-B2-like isoform X2 [Epargyreus clarus]|uniref:G2/mitotic-specific cyclin-B2-like isoform X2 n=1 Tax=Epargyreus clarus TaxID=520877 RepID=UPI003C2F41EE